MAKIGDLSEIRGEKIFEWKVKDFFSLRDAIDTRYESPDFHFFGIIWYLVLYPNGHTSIGSGGWIDLYLNRLSSGCPITLDYSLALQSADGNKDNVKEATAEVFDKPNAGSGFPKIILRSVLMERKADLAPSDEMTIICTLTNTAPVTLSPIAVTDDKSVQTPSYIDARFSLEQVSDDFTKLLIDGPNHDVEFTCGDQTIKAHKNIISCRSKVFASMLQSDMVEGRTGRVNIQDMDATIFQQFLGCLYTGSPPELTVDTMLQLYRASDKYAVDTLKQQCADFLMDNLSVENACEILALADRHNDSVLKNCVLDYIFKENIPVVGEKWTDFCNENQKLAVEVLNLFCQHIYHK